MQSQGIEAEVLCFCGECAPEQTFRCEECMRQVPWCFGADDEFFELCDDCAVKRMAANEAGDWTSGPLAVCENDSGETTSRGLTMRHISRTVTPRMGDPFEVFPTLDLLDWNKQEVIERIDYPSDP